MIRFLLFRQARRLVHFKARVAVVICSLFVQRFTWRRILHLLRSATRHFCSLFVQQMRSCPSAESVHQTQVFSVLLAFPSLVNGWTIALACAEIDAFKRTKFCSLIVQPEEKHPSAAEGFKCK